MSITNRAWDVEPAHSAGRLRVPSLQTIKTASFRPYAGHVVMG